jgi:vitamin B12/bleomycin/antimicrobial peptide transport system ATP-binding/permease protein
MLSGTGREARSLRERRLIVSFLRLVLTFWSGPTRLLAWRLTAGFVLCLALNLALALALNLWNKFFFDALQHRNEQALKMSVGYIVLLALGTSGAALALLQVRMRLQLRWREWLTGALIARWLGARRHLGPGTPEPLDNPEARIAEDGRLSIEMLVDLAGGVINTVLALSSFVLVLWYVGGGMVVRGITIPGYLVVIVVLYTAMTSAGMYYLGWPLVACIEDKAEGEGNLRYTLTKVRQYAGSALGHEDDRKILTRSFGDLAALWLALIGRQAKMACLSGGSSVLSAALPLVLCAPKFLSGEMTLGDLMQASAAFVQVHSALNWPADNAMGLAYWSASARRVAALDLAYQAGETPRT